MEKLFEIVFEDADLLVVNKPAGLVCHPTKNGEMSSLIGRARLYLSCDKSELKTQDSKLKTPYLINRLDRETSGIVLIAKNPETAGELGKFLEARRVQKEYLAIVHGHVRESHGLVDVPLGKDESSIVAVKDCVRPDGAPAQTEYFVEQTFSRKIPPVPTIPVRHEDDGTVPSPAGAGEGGPAKRDWMRESGEKLVDAPGESQVPFSLLRIVPHTGRKHQIRIHLAHLGHPIVGDKLYGHDEDCYLALAQNRLTEAQRARLIFENQALHARTLKFEWRGQPVEFSCQPEPSFASFVAAPIYRGAH